MNEPYRIRTAVAPEPLSRDEVKAEEYGKRLRQLVIDMTGYDPADIVSQMKPKAE